MFGVFCIKDMTRVSKDFYKDVERKHRGTSGFLTKWLCLYQAGERGELAFALYMLKVPECLQGPEN